MAPHSFYASYPGAGHHWVASMGPYDEHLVRDFAAMELGFAVLLACAAIWFERRLVLVAGAAFFAATLPHFAYHLTTTGSSRRATTSPASAASWSSCGDRRRGDGGRRGDVASTGTDGTA